MNRAIYSLVATFFWTLGCLLQIEVFKFTHPAYLMLYGFCLGTISIVLAWLISSNNKT